MTMKFKRDPYVYLFPVGLFIAFYAGGIWIPFALGVLKSYPGPIHSHLMIGGFLLAYIQGFLMTALPRFLEVKTAKPIEIITALLLTLALMGSLLLNQFQTSYLFSALIFLNLVFFSLQRFFKRTENPPPSFVFVGTGILSGFLGALLMFLQIFPQMGRNLYFQGMILSLLLGVGSRLIPALMGFSPLPKLTKEKQNKAFILLAGLLFISFFLELLPNANYGKALRALITTFILFKFWKIWKWPPTKSWLARGLWISSWFLLLGVMGHALWPQYGIHHLHLFYIGGAGLTTLLISTRVTLAHGDHSLSLEKTSKTLLFIIVFILLAAITRSSSGFIPKLYISHLGYASVCWVVALVLWVIKFGRYI